MNASAVLFDMDGVLVDSEDYWVELQRERLLPEVVPDGNVDVSEITGMNYREIYDYLEGVHDLLAELEDRNVARAVVSSSPHDWIDIVLERFDLEDSFERVISAEEIDGPGKPEPDIFAYAADQLGLAPENCVVLEDSAHGIEAAVRAGTICIAYDIDAHDDIDYSDADVVVTTPAGLREAVLEQVEG